MGSEGRRKAFTTEDTEGAERSGEQTQAKACATGGPARYNFRVATVSPTLRVKVLFFGRLRELTGLAEEAGELPEGATLAQVFERYAERYPKLAGFRNSMVVSRNQEFAAWDTRVSAGDEIAFLPPVSGG
jgi:sulfur-carrier protein